MARKKYGIRGLMEYQGCFHAGKVDVNIHFKGGMLTAYGVTPATFATHNKFVQIVIENSSEFKSGKIELLDVDLTDEEIGAQKKAEEDALAAQKQEEGLQEQQTLAANEAEGEVKSFSDWGTARQWLKAEGIASSKLTSNDKIKEEAAKLGYSLVIE